MSVLQILMNVKNKFLSAHQTLSASTYQVPLFAQVGSDYLMTHICLIFGTFKKKKYYINESFIAYTAGLF